jgi:hypothetical protein
MPQASFVEDLLRGVQHLSAEGGPQWGREPKFKLRRYPLPPMSVAFLAHFCAMASHRCAIEPPCARRGALGLPVPIGIPERRKVSLTILQVICRMVAKGRRRAQSRHSEATRMAGHGRVGLFPHVVGLAPSCLRIARNAHHAGAKGSWHARWVWSTRSASPACRLPDAASHHGFPASSGPNRFYYLLAASSQQIELRGGERFPLRVIAG